MIQSKRAEWEQACRKWPDLPPFVLLKLSMTWYGAVLSEQALDRLQEPDYCFGKLEPFGIRFHGRPSGKVMPGAILLRDGTNVYINYGETYTDPYQIDWNPETEEFLLKEGEEVIDCLDFVPRPDFYGKVTSRGTSMEAVAEARAQKLIMTAFQRCRLWEGGDQCHFCAFFSGGNSLGIVDCEDVFETVREALKEPGRFQEIYVSGGTDFGGQPPFSQEVERYIRVLQAAGRNFDGRFASQLMAPAYPREVLRRIYDETGLTSYCPNIEVWDKRLFGILCPGKEKWIGRDAWIRRTIDAVEIFGKGNVCTQVVAGAELARPYGFETVDQALKSNLEACEFFAREGVICLSTIWRPHRAARLGFQPMPPLEYYIRLAREFHEIRRSYGLRTTDDDYRHCGNHPDSDLERMDGTEKEAGEKTRIDIGNRKSWAPLSETAVRMLADPACRKHLVFSGEEKSLVSGVTVQTPPELLRHLPMRIATRWGRCPPATTFSYGQRSECADLSELLLPGSNHETSYEVSSLTSPDGVSMALALEQKDEHSALGRALTGAVWFSEPVTLRLDTGSVSLKLAVSVHRCHLAGPLFTKKYLELREMNPEAVAASVWELRQTEHIQKSVADFSHQPHPLAHPQNPYPKGHLGQFLCRDHLQQDD